VTADPQEIPSGVNQTALSVHVNNPFPDNGLVVVTELTTSKGVIDDPFALETTYVCLKTLCDNLVCPDTIPTPP